MERAEALASLVSTARSYVIHRSRTPSVSWPKHCSLPLMNQPAPRFQRFERLVEITMLAVFAALFAYALAAWLGIWPDETPHEPFGFVCLTGGMVLQPVAAMVRERSRAASYTLLLISVLLLILAIGIIAS